jgi:hypothetical protein
MICRRFLGGLGKAAMPRLCHGLCILAVRLR